MEVYVDWLEQPKTLSRRTRERLATTGSPLLEDPNTLEQAKDRCLAVFNTVRERWRGRLAEYPSYEDCEAACLNDFEQSGFWEVYGEEHWSMATYEGTHYDISATEYLTGPGVIVCITVAEGFLRE